MSTDRFCRFSSICLLLLSWAVRSNFCQKCVDALGTLRRLLTTTFYSHLLLVTDFMKIQPGVLEACKFGKHARCQKKELMLH